MLSQKTIAKIKKAMSAYPNKRSACMSALRIAQIDSGSNSLEEDMFRQIADILGMKPVQVNEVAAFYSMYNVERPVGKYHIQVCANISCSLLGAENIINWLEKELNISTGETTPDGKFTLSTVECLGSCGTAPMMQVNQDYFEDLTEDRLEKILESFE